MVNFFPLIASIIAAVFAALLLLQYFKRKKLHQLIWLSALALWFLTTLLEYLGEGEVFGWTVESYKIYYVLTAPMVALLGCGTLFLLTHRPWGKYFLIYIAAVSIPLFALGLTAEVDTAILATGSEIGGTAMPSYVRFFTYPLNIPGGLVLVLGPLYSYWLDRSRRYNLLISIGGFFPLLGGLKARFGDLTFFYLFEMVGTIILFVGFVLSMEYIKTRHPPKQ